MNDNEKALLDCARELAKLQGKKAPSTKAMFATVLELYIASGKTPQKQKKHGANTVVIDSPKLSDDIREFCRLKECTQYELGSASEPPPDARAAQITPERPFPFWKHSKIQL